MQEAKRSPLPLTPAIFRVSLVLLCSGLLFAPLRADAAAAVFPEIIPPGLDRILYKSLNWADYRVDDTAPGMSAQTQTFIGYRYKARATGGSDRFTAIVTSVQFYGGIDRAKSWRRSSVRQNDFLLLQHEQGHLDINEVKVRQLQSLNPADMPIGVGKTPKDALADLDKQMIRIYKAHVAEMQAAQRRYDDETAHGTRRELQSAWTASLHRALQAVGPAKQMPPGATTAHLLTRHSPAANG